MRGDPSHPGRVAAWGEGSHSGAMGRGQRTGRILDFEFQLLHPLVI